MRMQEDWEAEKWLQPIRSLGVSTGLLVSNTPRTNYPAERTCTHCTGGCVDFGAELDGPEKSRPHFHSIRGSSTP